MDLRNKENVNTQNSAIITLKDFERIKDTCALINKDTSYIQNKSYNRKAMHEKSNLRTQNWPNTIEATRRKKEEDRIKHLEELEIQRRKQGRF